MKRQPPSSLALGCWKPFRGDTRALVEFVRRAHGCGFRAWDLGEGYRLFGHQFELLNLSALGLRRQDVDVTFKIGASTMCDGEVFFEAAKWTSILDGFLERSKLGHVDRLLLWTVPAGLEHEELFRWLYCNIERGSVRGIGFSNLHPLQHELFMHTMRRCCPALVEHASTVQIRASRFLPHTLEDVSWYASQGLSVQAYGMLHSGLACSRGENTHVDYVAEYDVLHDGVRIQRHAEGPNFVRSCVEAASRHGAETLIVGMTSLDQLSPWE